MSDNQTSDSVASEPAVLDVNQAASAFANMLDPQPEEPGQHAEAEPEPQEAEPEEQAEDDPVVTVKINGQDVDVKLSELKNGYQRQADYTRKTMEVAEQRKTAESEISKARQERQQYMQGLNQATALLQAQLQESSKVDWQALLESDPVEYLKQQHLAQSRQAQLQQVFAEQQKVAQIQQAEQQQAYAKHLEQQQAELLAKLPDWKDANKAKAEKTAIREFLQDAGFSDGEINNVADSRAILMARKAMLYDQMVSKAQAAAKKVETLPKKVERPGAEGVALDKRTATYQRFAKSGSMQDAASVFASLL